jgi:hypothetical protein
MHHDTTAQESHRSEWSRFKGTVAVREAIAAAAGFGWVEYKKALYRINKIDGDKSFKQSWSYQQDAPPAPWPPLPSRGAPTRPHPGTTPWGRKENADAAAQQQNAAWLRQAAQPKSRVEEMQAVLAVCKQESKKDMPESVEKALSAKAAASPAADAAQGDGGAGERALEARVQKLEAKVADLTDTKKKLQEVYFECFAKGKAREHETFKLPTTI